jgi:hypothetical protein
MSSTSTARPAPLPSPRRQLDRGGERPSAPANGTNGADAGRAAVAAVELHDVDPHAPAVPPSVLPVYKRHAAPKGLATRRQLRDLGLRKGGQDPVAEVETRGPRNGFLYEVARAQPVRPMTLPMEVALDKAMAARQTCPRCLRRFHGCLSTRIGLCLECHDGTPIEPTSYTLPRPHMTVPNCATPHRSGTRRRTTTPMITITSFGHANGDAPEDYDIRRDLRPYRTPELPAELQEQTSTDQAVIDAVLGIAGLPGVVAMTAAAAARSYNAGQNTLHVIIGSATGRHRAPVVADQIARVLRQHHYDVEVTHRDLPARTDL